MVKPPTIPGPNVPLFVNVAPNMLKMKLSGLRVAPAVIVTLPYTQTVLVRRSVLLFTALSTTTLGALPCMRKAKLVVVAVLPNCTVPPAASTLPCWFQSAVVSVLLFTIKMVPPDMLNTLVGSVEVNPKEGEVVQPPDIQMNTLPTALALVRRPATLIMPPSITKLAPAPAPMT